MRTLLFLFSLLLVLPLAAQDTPPAMPAPMPLVDEGGQDVTNILLMGMATHNEGSNALTDTLLLLSYNRTAHHASILSLPRDLYVYLPNQQMMAKLNQAYYYGEKVADDGFSGLDELKATLLYNLGVQVDYTARVNFNGFVRLIDRLGGVQISVDCAIQDWRLIEPQMDRTIAENYAKFTLEQGVYQMDGDTALWYVRSRKTSTDLDRGRRQQDMLRAIWRTIRRKGLLESFPALWDSFGEVVTTDMPLDQALAYVPDLLDFDTSDVSYFIFRANREVASGYTPDEFQRYILVPDRDAIAALMQRVMQASTTSQVQAAQPTVAIINATGSPRRDFVAQIAADRLELEGFLTQIVSEDTPRRDYNHIVDYTGDDKGSQLPLLMRVLSTTIEGIEVLPDADRSVDYKVYVGNNYQFYACTRPIIPPKPDTDATPDPNG